MRVRLAAIALVPALASAADLDLVGAFANVRSDDEGEHCGGYSVSLWKYRGERIIGLLDVHSGLCGDPPCGAIADARLDSSSGRLAFSTSVSGRRLAFDGKLTPRALEGRLDDTAVMLPVDTSHEPAPWDTSAKSWCDFWSRVRRCTGVRELCESLKPGKNGQPKLPVV